MNSEELDCAGANNPVPEARRALSPLSLTPFPFAYPPQSVQKNGAHGDPPTPRGGWKELGSFADLDDAAKLKVFAIRLPHISAR